MAKTGAIEAAQSNTFFKFLWDGCVFISGRSLSTICKAEDGYIKITHDNLQVAEKVGVKLSITPDDQTSYRIQIRMASELDKQYIKIELLVWENPSKMSRISLGKSGELWLQKELMEKSSLFRPIP